VSLDRIEASRQSFVTKAVAVHGQRYDYSKADYTGWDESVEIVCKVHGSFFQTPNSHLSGSGCLKCGLSNPRSRKGRPPITNTEEFLNRAREVHGGAYDYSATEYLNYQTKVKIRCRRHGEFIQSPTKHLSGQGCEKCGIERRARERREKYRATFITRAHEVHGGKYDYSESTYEKAKLPVKIRCLEHGQFEQSPQSRLQGSGCPECGQISVPRQH
jgi:Zn finger protein HypA/HybF involved in hydrogenase expression